MTRQRFEVDTLLACIIVVVLHLLFFRILTAEPESSHSDPLPEDVLQVIFLPAKPNLAKPVLISRASSSTRPASTSPRQPTLSVELVQRSVQSEPAVVVEESAALVRTQLDDHWTRPTSTTPDAGTNFRRDPLGERPAALRTSTAPERFRLRKSITPEDMIKGTAQILGLWPPGYTTDPCPEIARNIADLMTDAGAAGRKQLGLELQRQQRHCP